MQEYPDLDFVVPCNMAEMLSMSWCDKLLVICCYADASCRVKNVFADLENPPAVYLAICTEDSSLVYYKISSGFIKPPL